MSYPVGLSVLDQNIPGRNSPKSTTNLTAPKSTSNLTVYGQIIPGHKQRKKKKSNNHQLRSTTESKTKRKCEQLEVRPIMIQIEESASRSEQLSPKSWHDIILDANSGIFRKYLEPALSDIRNDYPEPVVNGFV